MQWTLAVTEDSPVWGAAPPPEPAGVLRQAADGIWVADFPDGSVEVVWVKGSS